MSKSALVILAEGFEEIEAITPIDLLRRAGVAVTVAGLDKKSITGAHNISIECDTTVTNIHHHPFDAVVIPGGMPGTLNLLNSDLVLEIISKSNRDNKLVAAICAAPRVLDSAGALTSRSFTCFPGAEEFISHGTHVNETIVVDKNTITARSATNAVDFGLKIIEKLVSSQIAQDVAQKIVL